MQIHGRIVPADVAVIGAGAAGLAAARRLAQHGLRTIVLEARDRAGGRAHTLRTRDGAYPVELGPEFIHGKAEATMALLQESGQSTLEVPDTLPDVWESTQRILDRVDVRGPDTSVDAFLKTVRDDGVAQTRMLIEGFDAAIAHDASVIAIAEEWRSDVNETQARPRAGYGMLMDHLANPLGASISFNTRVDRIAWQPQHVKIEAVRDGEPLTIAARAAIVTLPIGVLHANTVTFTPALPASTLGAIEYIAMGPVVKVVLEFRSIFWDEGFFQPPAHAAFRTVWSRLPQQAPVLAAWSGGDAAQRILERGIDPVDAALETCEMLFPKAGVREQLLAAHYHDWQNDPYARGAYSYLRVNAGDARERLAESIAETLVFAGEAACAADAGTVAGALESGDRAAAQVVESMRR